MKIEITNKMEKNERPFWIIFGVSLVVLGVSCFVFHKCLENYQVQLGALGSVFTIAGLVISIREIMKTRQKAAASLDAAKETRLAVDKGIENLTKQYTSIDISLIARLPNEVQSFIELKNYKLAEEKMKDLKDFLIELRNNPAIKDMDGVGLKLDEYISTLSVRILAFTRVSGSNKEPYALNKTAELMEDIRSNMRDWASKFKYNIKK